MNKLINVTIFLTGSLLTYVYGLGLTFFIPVAFYYSIKNYGNVLLIITISFALFFFNLLEVGKLIYIVFLFLLVMHKIFVARLENFVYNVGFVFIVSIICALFTVNNVTFYSLFLFSSISTLTYIFFSLNQEQSLVLPLAINSIMYNEILISFVAIMGFATINIYGVNIGFMVTFFIGIYFTALKQYGKTLFYIFISVCVFQFYFKIEYSYVLFLLLPIYLFPKIISTVLLFSCSLFLIFIKPDIFPMNLLIGIMISALLFEIFRFNLIYEDSDEAINLVVYENVVKKVNNDTTAFATFLDYVNQDMSESRGQKYKINEVIKTIYKNHCEGCYNKKECMQKNKGKLYYYYKMLIFNRENEEKLCPFHNDMIRTAQNLARKYDINNEEDKSYVMNVLTSGLSTMLRQYQIDNAIKEEIKISIFNSIHKNLIDYGFFVSLFNVKSIIKDNFLVEVGIRETEFKNFYKKVEKICNYYIKEKVTLIYQSSERGRIYFNIVPRINYEVNYGFGALAPVGNSVCGDNYIVKQLGNSKIMAAISDGMGKGIKASSQSVQTLKMLDRITNMNIMTETALQILNTLFFIQDYQEIYSTLDFIEINRQTGEGLFYKAGGTTTYIFRADGSVEKINNTNLPFGIEELIEVKKIQLKNDDLIIMASDGIFDGINNQEIVDYISNIKKLDPQKMIYEILNFSRYSSIYSKDDMSIVALKIKSANN